MKDDSNLIIYTTADGKTSVILHARDGMVWMNPASVPAERLIGRCVSIAQQKI